MLILGLDGLDAVQIGKDIVIGIHKKGNKWKLSIVAPKSLKINRISGDEWSDKSGKLYLKNLTAK